MKPVDWLRRCSRFTFFLMLMLYAPHPTAAEAYEEVAVTDGGTITGHVQYTGTVPARKELKITDDVEVCAKTQKYSEKLVVSENRGIQHVVVSLANVAKGKPWGPKTVEFVQRDCRYDPHVVVVPVDGTVDIINDDPLTHNIHTFAFDNPTMNKGQPKTVRKISMTVDYPEIIRVNCDVHSWMKAWWKVVEHPYFVVTDAEGNFTLSDVPPGTYQLEIWHESLGKLSQEVTVKNKETTRVSLQMKAKKRKRIKFKK